MTIQMQEKTLEVPQINYSTSNVKEKSANHKRKIKKINFDSIILNCLLLWFIISTVTATINNVGNLNFYKILYTICQNLLN